MVLIEIIGKLGQLSRAEYRLILHHKGKILFSVALSNVQVEHKGDQRALQPRARTTQHIEARTCDLGATLKVKDAQCGTQIPMRLWLKVKFRELANRAKHNILFF